MVGSPLIVTDFGFFDDAKVTPGGTATLGNRINPDAVDIERLFAVFVVAGQSGISGHVDLGDGVQVASKSAVYKSAAKGARLTGIPAMDSMDWKRQQVRFKRLQELERRLSAVEKKLDDKVKSG